MKLKPIGFTKQNLVGGQDSDIRWCCLASSPIWSRSANRLPMWDENGGPIAICKSCILAKA